MPAACCSTKARASSKGRTVAFLLMPEKINAEGAE
jgi:hypothetical protein